MVSGRSELCRVRPSSAQCRRPAQSGPGCDCPCNAGEPALRLTGGFCLQRLVWLWHGSRFCRKTCPQALEDFNALRANIWGGDMYRASAFLSAIALAIAGSAIAAPVVPFPPDHVLQAVENLSHTDHGPLILVQNRARGGGRTAGGRRSSSPAVSGRWCAAVRCSCEPDGQLQQQ